MEVGSDDLCKAKSHMQLFIFLLQHRPTQGDSGPRTGIERSIHII